MTRSQKVFALTTLFSLALATPAFAQKLHEPGHAQKLHEPAQEWPFAFGPLGLQTVIQQAGLSQAQLRRIEEIIRTHKRTLEEQRIEVEKKERDLKEYLDLAQVDRARVEATVDALLEARTRLSKTTTMMMVQMREVLTQEQWLRMAQLEFKRKAMEATAENQHLMAEVAAKIEALKQKFVAGPEAAELREVQQRLEELRASAAQLTEAQLRERVRELVHKLRAFDASPSFPSAGAKRVRVGAQVQSAKLTYKVQPQYPVQAKQQRIQGTVLLEALIGVTGEVSGLQVISGHPLLAPAAMEAVRQWRYQPTLLSGEPVEVVTTVDVVFTLSQ